MKRRKAMIAFLLLLTSALSFMNCSGGGGGTTTTGTPQTPQGKVLALENSGAIPKLDRSTSVKGHDSNNNGVRDDVEIYIANNYSTESQRGAATQAAKGLQNALLVDKTDIIAVKSVDREISRGINCIYSKFNGGNGSRQPAEVVKELEAISTNTKSRLLAYLAFNKALDGTSSALPEGDTCE